MHWSQEVTLTSVSTRAIDLDELHLHRDAFLAFGSHRALLRGIVLIESPQKTIAPLDVPCNKLLVFSETLKELVPCALCERDLSILNFHTSLLFAVV